MVRSTFALALCALLFMVGGCGGGSSPGDRAVTFMRAIESGNADKAVEIMPPDMPAEAKAKVKGMVTTQSELLKSKKKGISSLTVDKEEINGDDATVTITTVFGDGTKETENVKMKKVDGKWYMKGM